MKKIIAIIICSIGWCSSLTIPYLYGIKEPNPYKVTVVTIITGMLCFALFYEFYHLLISIKFSSKEENEKVIDMWNKHEMYKYALKEHLIEPHLLLEDVSISFLQKKIINHLKL